MLDLFDVLDSDGSGAIDRSELRTAFIEVGIPPTDREFYSGFYMDFYNIYFQAIFGLNGYILIGFNRNIMINIGNNMWE